jgi:hypothetical protein
VRPPGLPTSKQRLSGPDWIRSRTEPIPCGRMITAAVEARMPESLIMQRSGHRSMTVLQRYIRPASVFSCNPLARAL